MRGSDQLKAAVLAVKGARRDVRNDLNRATRATMNEPWRQAVAAHATTDTDRKVIVRGARIVAGNPPVAVAATSTRALHGGMVPARDWPVIEFGADQGTRSTYRSRSRKGRAFTVHERHTTRQLPARSGSGRVAFAALADLGPRFVSLWVQTVIRTFAEAYEKGGSR